jgi:hypothetical protein
MSKADERHDIAVDQYISSLEDEQLKSDALVLQRLMHKISGEDPILYGFGTIGFGVYKYHYESGRKGEAHTLGFYPRKGKITIYLMDGTARYTELLTKLGKHSTTGYCIHIKQLSDVELLILEQIIQKSYDHIMSEYKDGPIDHILWHSNE